VRTRLLAGVAVGLTLLTAGCDLQPNDNTFPGQVAVGDDGYTVTVLFDAVENLVPNSNVQLDNATIGTIAAIEVEEWRAKVTLRLQESHPVPADSTFSIGQKTLLGAQYVEVTPPVQDPPAAGEEPGRHGGSGRMLADGDVVPVSATGTYPGTEQVLGAAALLLNNGGLSQISTITGELSAALDGRTPDARHLIVTTNRLLGVLDANKTDIVRALESLDRLSSELADNQQVVAHAIDRITPGLRALNKDRENLVRAVTSAGRASTSAAQVIAVNERALLSNLDSLVPILGRLGEVSDQLPEALKIGLTIPFPAMTTTNAVRGDYANLFATLDLTLPSLGRAFLGGEPPALQAGNPVLDPLSGPDEEPAGPGAAGNPGRGDDPSGSESSAGAQADDGSADGDVRGGSCLLGLLGDCR
jgi:phospholipid/cholesterol/gamma-HCH transport system substrate-binding protein